MRHGLTMRHGLRMRHGMKIRHVLTMSHETRPWNETRPDDKRWDTDWRWAMRHGLKLRYGMRTRYVLNEPQASKAAIPTTSTLSNIFQLLGKYLGLGELSCFQSDVYKYYIYAFFRPVPVVVYTFWATYEKSCFRGLYHTANRLAEWNDDFWLNAKGSDCPYMDFQ